MNHVINGDGKKGQFYAQGFVVNIDCHDMKNEGAKVSALQPRF